MVVDHVNETHKVEFCNKASKMKIYFIYKDFVVYYRSYYARINFY